MSPLPSLPAVVAFFLVVLALLSSSSSAPLSPVRRDVWDPKIISPNGDSVWVAGCTFLVTWDTSSEPAQLTDPEGKIFLREGDQTQPTPIMSGFMLADGQVDVTVPASTTAGLWRIVLMGDSGDWSDEFPIRAPSSAGCSI